METGEILRIEERKKVGKPPTPAGRKRKRRRKPRRHEWEYQGRAGIFDPSRVYICKKCGRRSVRRPRKPRKKPPLAR
jgi:hypothetical protein